MSVQEITIGPATLAVARNGLGYWGTFRPPALPTTLGPCDTLEELLERARARTTADGPTVQPTHGPRLYGHGEAEHPCCVCGEPSAGRDVEGELACGRHGARR